jgi:hypothetical protein
MTRRSELERAIESLAELGEEPRVSNPRRTTACAKRLPPAPARHNRKCSVCRHRDREAIEQDFLRWRSPDQIAEDYGIADHSSVYRHAHATGLFDRRAATIRIALEPIIERAMTVEVTADGVVRAIELLARLNGDGQLISPPKYVIHHSCRPTMSRREAPRPRKPNRQNAQVELDATH